MSEALHKRYRDVMFEQPGGSSRLQKGYARWCRAHDAAFDQIHRFYTLTNSLPVAGDRLCSSYRDGGEDLQIEQRLLFSTPDSPSILLVYKICADYIEELEEYQEGDYVEENSERV